MKCIKCLNKLNVLLLSAGFGTRLGKYTKLKPKCLVKINKKTILDIWIEKLNNNKIDKIFINVHYKSQLIKDHIKKYYPNNTKIILLNEEKLLGTSKTILKNLKLFRDKKLLVIHSDNYTEFKIDNLIKADNKNKKFLITMLSFKTYQPEKTGTLEVKKNILKNYFHKNKYSESRIGNAAIYILGKKFLGNYRNDYSRYKDFSKDVLPTLIDKAYVHHTNKFFIDIGDPSSLMKARSWIIKK